MLTEETKKVLEIAANGNAEAFRFLSGCFHLWHGIDDVIDGDVPGEQIKERIIQLFLYAKDLYTTPFYRLNWMELSGAIDAVSNAYADSVMWENVDSGWQHELSDILRSQGVDIVCLVAKLCGGYEHMRRVSPLIRELSFFDQRGS